MSKTNHSDLECKVPSGKNAAAGESRRDRKTSVRKSADPETVRLRKQVVRLEKENAELRKRVSVLERQLAELLRLHYGEKADRPEGGGDGSPDAGDIPKFEFGVAEPSSDGERSPGGRLPNFPGHLDTEVRTIEPSECCPRCKSKDWTLVGVDEMETLDAKPVAYYKLVTRRPKVKCANCEKIRQAPAPKGLFPRGYLVDNLVADMVTDHVFMAMPINRQARRMEHAGLPDIRKTLSNYYHKLARELKPMLEQMKLDLLARGNVFADDTVFKINLKKRKGKLTRGRFWVYAADDRGHGGSSPVIVCIEATEDWKMDHPKKFLETFTGKLHTDSYPGWLSIKKQAGDRFPLQLCWAHARRYFVKVTLKFSGAAQWEVQAANEVIRLMRELSVIESRIYGMSPAEKLAVRGEHSAPLVDSVRSELESARLKTTGDSVLDRAIDYMLDNWEFFTTFLRHGEVGMHTNFVEQHIRPVADIRKSSGHSETLEGAESLAVHLAFALTCKANGINPYEWLRDVVKRLPRTPADEVWKLTPYNWTRYFGGGSTGPDDGKDGGTTATGESNGDEPTGECATVEAAPDHAEGDDAAIADSGGATECDQGEANVRARDPSPDGAADIGQVGDRVEFELETGGAVEEPRQTGCTLPPEIAADTGQTDSVDSGLSDSGSATENRGDSFPAGSSSNAGRMQALITKLRNQPRQWLPLMPMWLDPLLNALRCTVLQTTDRFRWQEHAVASGASGAGAGSRTIGKAAGRRSSSGKRDPPVSARPKYPKTFQLLPDLKLPD